MNYVLFFPDELRAKTLSCYGHPTIRTPSFDRLSLEGVTLNPAMFRTRSVRPRVVVCLPVHMSIRWATARYGTYSSPMSTICWRPLSRPAIRCASMVKTICFRQRRPQTAPMYLKTGPQPGPDRAENTAGYGQKGYYDFVYRPMAGSAEDTGDWANVQAGIDFIRSWKCRRSAYVLFLPLLFPHCPYTVPEPYYSMYGEEDVMPLLPYGQGKADYMELIRRYRQLDDPSALRRAQALYMGMVTFTDMLLGRVMDALDEAGQRDKTVLIASSGPRRLCRGLWTGGEMAQRHGGCADPCAFTDPRARRRRGTSGERAGGNV